MGNTKSFDSGHEVFNEHDHYYMDRVESRNSKSFDQTEEGSLVQKNEGSTLSESSHASIVAPGPLRGNTHINIPSDFRGKQRERRRRLDAERILNPQRFGSSSKRVLGDGSIQPVGLVSPVSTDSSTTTKKVARSTSGGEKLDFQAAANWTCLKLEEQITALTFSRPSFDSSRPLLLAFGTENGKVGVTQLVDGNDQSRLVGMIHHGTIHRILRTERVRALDFSSDGKWLVIGGDDCQACFVKLHYENGEFGLQVLEKLEIVYELERVDRVWAVQFSPQQHHQLVAIGGFDGVVTIAKFDVQSEERLPVIEILAEISRPSLVLSLDWSPSGEMLAIGGSDKSCVIVDREWTVVGEVQRSAAVQAVRWSPDASSLAIGSHDSTVVVVDVESCSVVGDVTRCGSTPDTKEGQSVSARTRCRITDLAWSPSGDHLAIGDSNACCVIVETRGYLPVQEVQRAAKVSGVAWTEKSWRSNQNESNYLARAGDDGVIGIIKTNPFEEIEGVSFASTSSSESDIFNADLQSSRESCEVEISILPGNYAPRLNVFATAVAFSKRIHRRASKFLAVATNDGKITVFNPGTGDWTAVVQLVFPENVRSMSFAPKGKYLAVVGGDLLCIVSSKTWKVVHEIRLGIDLNALVFDELDDSLALGASDGSLILLDPARDWAAATVLEGDGDAILCLDTTDSESFAIGRDDGRIILYSLGALNDGSLASIIEFHVNASVNSLAFGVNGRFLAVGDANGLVGVYSKKGGWVLCHQIKSCSPVEALKWRGDGTFLGFGGCDSLQVLDSVAWTVVDELESVEGDMRFIDWSNDDKWLVVAGKSFACHLIDTESWEVKVSLLPRQHNQEGKEMKSTDPEANVSPLSLGAHLTWNDRGPVCRFREASRAFLEACDTSAFPHLKSLTSCLRMIQNHVNWVATMGSEAESELSQLDEGQPLIAVLGLLDASSCLMASGVEADMTTDDWWDVASFDLTQRNLRRIQAWNEKILTLDATAPPINTSVLTIMHQKLLSLTANQVITSCTPGALTYN